MKEKLTCIEFLFKDLLENAKKYAKNKEDYKKDRIQFKKGNCAFYHSDWNYMSKNYGKTAIKRKITYLRQELLNLEKLMDGDA